MKMSTLTYCWSSGSKYEAAKYRDRINCQIVSEIDQWSDRIRSEHWDIVS